ncbi:hypothetical protein PBCV1_a276L [Paramecium bursaria Chlorella virus 1]|uniref:Uncharacterized protein n=1 Tax=Paramecium bursaria Chlorella virus 1 TaxID=10506 RepID=Q84593_PBCV1|nr:hypothetical protein PBCV1_a276L [Paramecium bursaria Chlorella virus 1]AAC96644.1 hypothetical protein [Paramecium bursaria Chlorella virus 1]
MPRKIFSFQVVNEFFRKLWLYYIRVVFQSARSIVYKLLRVLIYRRFHYFSTEILLMNLIVFYVNCLFSIGSDDTPSFRVPKYQRWDVLWLKFPI